MRRNAQTYTTFKATNLSNSGYSSGVQSQTQVSSSKIEVYSLLCYEEESLGVIYVNQCKIKEKEQKL